MVAKYNYFPYFRMLSLSARQSTILCIIAASLLVSLSSPAAMAIEGSISFGEPVNFGSNYNSAYGEGVPRERADGLERFVASERAGTYGDYDLWVSTRATTDDDWSTYTNMGAVINTAYFDSNPSISPDGLALYFTSSRPGTSGPCDIWVARRPTVSQPWITPTRLDWPVNDSGWDAVPWISADGLSLYFESIRTGGYGGVDLWVTKRATVLHQWDAPQNLGPLLNSPDLDGTPIISSDGLLMFFTSDRGGYGGYDVWYSRRSTTDDEWEMPINAGPTINSSEGDGWPAISADGSMLYLASRRVGGYGGWDGWYAPIFYGSFCGDDDHPYPTGDLNRDCRVDWFDFAMLCEHWLDDNNP